jgi:hypothetical protein
MVHEKKTPVQKEYASRLNFTGGSDAHIVVGRQAGPCSIMAAQALNQNTQSLLG